jgi:hypothetical protein
LIDPVEERIMDFTRKGLLLIAALIVILALCCGCADGGGGASPPDVDGGVDTNGDGDGNDDGNGGGDGGNPSDETDVALIPQWDPADFDAVYTVGPGADYDDPGQVPWESLQAGTLVQILWRDEPYRCKWVINTVATELNPLVVVGIADGGRRPVISGADAVTRQELNYWNENRSVVKVGGSNLPSDDVVPAHIVIQGLEIRSARPAYHFSDDDGQAGLYAENAAAVHVEVGQHIQIVDCVLHDAGNGLFSGHGSADLTIRGCHLYDNGIDGSIYHHNSYTESTGIIFEYNHYGALRSGALGNNLKDRSAGTVIRYNWIEGGNRQLDLVETDYADIATEPSYDRTFVYGNILVEPDGAGNSQILHYGGDGDGHYREGTLYFYHNTVISTRSGNTTLMRLATNAASADLRNNLTFATAGGDYVAITSGRGQIQLQHNWLQAGWQETHEAALDPEAEVVALANSEGDAPGFLNLVDADYGLAAGAPAADCGGQIATAAGSAEGPVAWQYRPHQARSERPADGLPDAGAFESIP